VTEPFIATGQAMAASHGLPKYRFIAMPHPIANLTDAELNARADVLTEQVLTQLKAGQPGE
jgi:hypothetical protein